MIDCRRTTELASDYLDHALPWRQRVAIRLHLLICEGCRRYLRQMTAIRSALRGLGDAPPVAVRGAITGHRLVLAGAMASVLLMVVGGLWQRFGGGDFAAAAVVQARDSDGQLAAQALPAAQVAQMLASYGLTSAQPLTDVVFAHRCHVMWYRAAHLVLRTPAGTVAVFLAPGVERKAVQTATFDQRLVALYPVPAGLVSIVADSQAGLDAAFEVLRAAALVQVPAQPSLAAGPQWSAAQRKL